MNWIKLINLASRPKESEGQSFWKWSLVTLLLVALAIATFGLYLYLVVGSQHQWPPLLVTPITHIVSYGGLTIVFGLLMLRKQRELHLLRLEHQQTRMREESLRCRLLELSSLFEAVFEANLQVELDSMLEVITERVLCTLEADQSSIMLIDERTGDLRCRAISGKEAEFARGARVRVGEGVSGRVAENNQILLLNADDMKSRFPEEIKTDRNIVSAICVPLPIQGKPIGVLNVNRLGERPEFIQSEAELLGLFASHITIAIQRNEELQKLGCTAVRLEDTNRELRAGIQQSQELSQMKSMFLNVVNQELRVPLESVINCAESLARPDLQLDLVQRSTLSRILVEHASKLRKCTNDLVELSLLDQGLVSLNLATSSVNQIVEEFVLSAKPDIARRGIIVETALDPELPLLSLDHTKLNQALSRLFSNIVASSQLENNSIGLIRVTTRRESEYVLVAISIWGTDRQQRQLEPISGIPKTTFGSKSQGNQGMRVSLELVRTIVEMHGGIVRIEDSPRDSSHILLQLPIQQTEPTQRLEGSKETSKGPMDQAA